MVLTLIVRKKAMLQNFVGGHIFKVKGAYILDMLRKCVREKDNEHNKQILLKYQMKLNPRHSLLQHA